MPGALAGFALAGASLFVFPGVGDTVREPKWVWLWGCALFAFGFLSWALVRRKEWRWQYPVTFLPFLVYLVFQPYFFAPASKVWPFTACLFSLLLLSSLPVTNGKWFDRLLFLASLLQLAQGALQCLGWDFLFSQHAQFENPHPLVGFLGQETIYGAWMAPLAWYWFGKGRSWLFGLCTLAALATGSAFSALAWVAGLGALLVWHHPRRGLLFVGGLGVLGALALNYNQGFFYDNGRFLAWRMILSASLERPWFGYGIDSFAREFRFHQGFGGAPWIQAHSEPLELFFGGGLVGLMLGALALWPLWARRSQWWGRKECLPWFLALVAIFANALGNFPLHIAPIALLAVISYFRLVRAGLSREP